MTRGSILNERPERKKQYASGSGNGVRFVSCSMQGYRKTMEDRCTALTSLAAPLGAWSFFGVFDGHSGHRVSQYCQDHLHRAVFDEVKSVEDGSLSFEEEKADLVKRAVVQGFLKLDAEMLEPWLEEVLLTNDRSGSTAVCALVSPDAIYLANCGDSRGLIVSGDCLTVVTRDHKPDDPDEKRRIEAAGGCVRKGRVGKLAMSRCLGGFMYKLAPGRSPVEQKISPEPDVFHWARQPQDQFIFLASDGVWDRLDHDMIDVVVRRWLAITDDLERICGELVDLCFDLGSADNISVLLIVLPGAPKPSEEALRIEMEFRCAVELAVKVVWEDARDSQLDLMTLNYLVGELLLRNGVGDPPEYSTLTRRIFTERAWKELHPGEELRLEPDSGLAERDMRTQAIITALDAREVEKTEGTRDHCEKLDTAVTVQLVDMH